MCNLEDTFANRLKKILEIRNMKQVELCEKTKLSSGLINKYLKGKAFARQDKLSILADALDTIMFLWIKITEKQKLQK